MNRCCICGRKINNPETKYGIEFCKTCEKYEKKLTKLKAENESVTTAYESLCQEINPIKEDRKKLYQQLKEKDEEIAQLEKELNKVCAQGKDDLRHWIELETQLKTNTHQVCEKIRNKLGSIEDILINCGNGKEDALNYFNNILKEIEKGE